MSWENTTPICHHLSYERAFKYSCCQFREQRTSIFNSHVTTFMYLNNNQEYKHSSNNTELFTTTIVIAWLDSPADRRFPPTTATSVTTITGSARLRCCRRSPHACSCSVRWGVSIHSYTRLVPVIMWRLRFHRFTGCHITVKWNTGEIVNNHIADDGEGSKLNWKRPNHQVMGGNPEESLHFRMGIAVAHGFHRWKWDLS